MINQTQFVKKTILLSYELVVRLINNISYTNKHIMLPLNVSIDFHEYFMTSVSPIIEHLSKDFLN